MKVRISIRTNKVGSQCTEVVELEDENYLNEDGTVNEDAVNEMAKDAIWNMAEWGWEVVES